MGGTAARRYIESMSPGAQKVSDPGPVRVGLTTAAIFAVSLCTCAAIGCSSSLAPKMASGGRGGGQQGGADGAVIGAGGFLGGSGGTSAEDGGCPSGAQCPMGACAAAGSCACGLPLVCFGSDPTVYEKYLNPRDGGYSLGYCPTSTDFHQGCGEGSICYFGCGPLAPSEISAALDAGVRSTTDGGPDRCCFWVLGIPGV
jgi:hypothetical protein